MTDKNDMLRQIEEGLGSEGSPEMARQMFAALDADGAITFDADTGFELHDDEDGTRWTRALQAVIEGAAR